MQSTTGNIASNATVDLPNFTTSNDSCAHCRGRPDASIKFMRCSGCRVVNYCSTQCWKADWRSHKAFCRALKKNMLLSTEQERINMKALSSWVDSHYRSLCQAAYAAICNSRSDDRADGFDCSTHYLWLQLKGRPDSVGDPSRSFHVHAAELRRLEEFWLNGSVGTPAFDLGSAEHDLTPEDRALVAHTNAKLELQAAFLASLPDERTKCLASIPPSKHSCFVGILPCRYEIVGPGDEGQVILDYVRVIHDEDTLQYVRDASPASPQTLHFPPSRHDLWFARLQRRVDLGLCFRRDKSTACDLERGLGRMTQEGPGGKWKWTPLIGEEAILETQGYHPIVSGLVY